MILLAVSSGWRTVGIRNSNFELADGVGSSFSWDIIDNVHKRVKILISTKIPSSNKPDWNCVDSFSSLNHLSTHLHGFASVGLASTVENCSKLRNFERVETIASKRWNDLNRSPFHSFCSVSVGNPNTNQCSDEKQRSSASINGTDWSLCLCGLLIDLLLCYHLLCCIWL